MTATVTTVFADTHRLNALKKKKKTLARRAIVIDVRLDPLNRADIAVIDSGADK